MRLNTLYPLLLKAFLISTSSLIFNCSQAQENHFDLTKPLSKELKQISGIVKDGNAIWAIIDTKNADIYKLDFSGNIIQRIHPGNFVLKDVEAVTADKKYVYIGDVGDNKGSRKDRSIIRILKSSIGNKSTETVNGELIHFTFPDEGIVASKKTNNYDCEAIANYKDSIYVFTKRRDDLKTGLYVLPKRPGTYVAKFKEVFKTKGLVTDAAMNDGENSLALIGYEDSHTKPFIWLLSKFSGSDFFSGNFERYKLTNEKKLDWQVEGITYKDDNNFFVSCEKTKDVTNTLYIINKDELLKSHKGKGN